MSVTPEQLAEWRRLCEAATPGPWFYDSYSRVQSEPLVRLAHQWHKENFGGRNLDEIPEEDWKRLAKEEPRTLVARVPVQAGDTATEQGGKDAEFIAAARVGWPATMDALEAERRTSMKWVKQHDAVLAASQARDAELALVTAERDRLAAEVARLSDMIDKGIEESVANAPMRFVEGGIEMEHWAIRHLAASLGKSLGDAVNYVETTVYDGSGDGNWYVVTIGRKNGKTPHQLRKEAEAERDRLAARVAELEEKVRRDFVARVVDRIAETPGLVEKLIERFESEDTVPLDEPKEGGAP